MAKRKTKYMGKIKHTLTTIDGIEFHSKMESQYYTYLKDLKIKGIVKSFILQPKFLLQDKFIIVDGEKILGEDPNFAKIKRKTKAKNIQDIEYIADFEVYYSDGRKIIIDVKGEETADFKLKKKMFYFQYPHETLELWTHDDKTMTWYLHDEYKKIISERKKAAKIKKLNRGAETPCQTKQKKKPGSPKESKNGQT